MATDHASGASQPTGSKARAKPPSKRGLATTGKPRTGKPLAGSRQASVFARPGEPRGGGLRAQDFLDAEGRIDVAKAGELLALRDDFVVGYQRLASARSRTGGTTSMRLKVAELAKTSLAHQRLAGVQASLAALGALEAELAEAIAPIEAHMRSEPPTTSEAAYFSGRLEALASTDADIRLLGQASVNRLGDKKVAIIADFIATFEARRAVYRVAAAKADPLLPRIERLRGEIEAELAELTAQTKTSQAAPAAKPDAPRNRASLASRLRGWLGA